MDDIRLVREISDADGVFGRLLLPAELGGLWWYTVEDDWRSNRKGESCIPQGRYDIVRTVYHRYNIETFEVTGVPNRSRILIHAGNTEEDTEGCILIGMQQGYLTVMLDEDAGIRNIRKRAVLRSKEAFREFMSAMRGIEKWPLLVTGVVG